MYYFLKLTALNKGSYLNIRYDHFYFILIPPFTKFFPMVQQPLVVQGLIIVQASLSQSHYTRYDSSGRVISPTQRPLLGNTQHSQERDIDAAGGPRNSNPGKRAAENPRLRKLGHWYQLSHNYPNVYKRHRIY